MLDHVCLKGLTFQRQTTLHINPCLYKPHLKIKENRKEWWWWKVKVAKRYHKSKNMHLLSHKTHTSFWKLFWWIKQVEKHVYNCMRNVFMWMFTLWLEAVLWKIFLFCSFMTHQTFYNFCNKKSRQFSFIIGLQMLKLQKRVFWYINWIISNDWGMLKYHMSLQQM